MFFCLYFIFSLHESQICPSLRLVSVENLKLYVDKFNWLKFHTVPIPKTKYLFSKRLRRLLLLKYYFEKYYACNILKKYVSSDLEKNRPVSFEIC